MCTSPTPVGDAVHFEIYKKARALEDVGCPAYKFYKFTIDKVRYPHVADGAQMAALQLYSSLGDACGLHTLPMGGVSVTAANDAMEDAARLVDGNMGTKWFDSGFGKGGIIVGFPTPTKVSGWDFATAADVPARDPVRWTVSGSYDGVKFTAIDTTHSHEDFPSSKKRGEWQGPFEFPCMGACSRAASTFAKVREGGFCSEAHGGGSHLLLHQTSACVNNSRAHCETKCLSKQMCTHMSFGTHEGGEQCSCLLSSGKCDTLIPEGDASFAVFRRPLLIHQFSDQYCEENDILDSTGSCDTISKSFCEEKCVRNPLCRYLSFGTAPGDAQCSCLLSSSQCSKRASTGDGWRYSIFRHDLNDPKLRGLDKRLHDLRERVAHVAKQAKKQ
jgi:hypothetical protein